MIIKTADNKKSVDVGTQDMFFSLYSTINVRLKDKSVSIENAMTFMKTGKCNHEVALSVAREFNLIRDYLSGIALSDLVYDMRDETKKAPWINNISPVITSCGNLFISKDGKDILYEIVAIMTYAYYEKVNVDIEK